MILGTRGSDLALAQSHLIEAALRARWPGLEIQTKIIKTSGDEGPGGSSSSGRPPATGAAGRKGLFTAEIERSLMANAIDVAVHSAKDLPSVLDERTRIAAVLPRAPVADVLVSKNSCDLESLPCGGVVATGSIRRSHQLRWKRPDLRIVALRGNVPTRLRKLSAEPWDGAVLAQAGLQRLGIMPNETSIQFEDEKFSVSVLDPDVFIPAGGQGIIAMQVRADDQQSRSLVEAISDSSTELCLRAEREFLRKLHADCDQPVGVIASSNGNIMRLSGQIFESEMTTPQSAIVQGPAGQPEQLAAELIRRLHRE
jgi:hydroxymethylbilane synthase